MTYNILTDTDFFRDLESGNTASIKADYGKFIEQTVNQCKKAISKVDMNIMLAYTETELMGYTEQKGETGAYAGKASHFLKELQDMAEDIAKSGATASQIEWTGTTTDLVELIYALKETGCVNNGEMLIGKMCEAMRTAHVCTWASRSGKMTSAVPTSSTRCAESSTRKSRRTSRSLTAEDNGIHSRMRKALTESVSARAFHVFIGRIPLHVPYAWWFCRISNGGTHAPALCQRSTIRQ